MYAAHQGSENEKSETLLAGFWTYRKLKRLQVCDADHSQVNNITKTMTLHAQDFPALCAMQERRRGQSRDDGYIQVKKRKKKRNEWIADRSKTQFCPSTFYLSRSSGSQSFFILLYIGKSYRSQPGRTFFLNERPNTPKCEMTALRFRGNNRGTN